MQRAESAIEKRWKTVRNRWKTALAVCVAAAVAVACYDAVKPVEVADQSHATDQASSAGQKNKRRVNRMAHVGELHNKMMDAYIRDLKRQSKLFAKPCTGAATWFATAPAAAAVRLGAAGDQVLDVARDNSSSLRDCAEVVEKLDQARRKARAKIIHSAYASPLPNEDIPISDSAAALLTQIQTAMGQLTSASSLDDQLDPIIGAAEALGGTDADAVLSYAAVASSSGHYWETNHATAAVALLPVSAGGACEVDCPGTEWETSWTPFSERRTPVQTVLRGPLNATGQACLVQLISQTGGWSDVAKADLWGAIGGAIYEKKWNPWALGVATGLASASQLSWHQLYLIGCYIFAM